MLPFRLTRKSDRKSQGGSVLQHHNATDERHACVQIYIAHSIIDNYTTVLPTMSDSSALGILALYQAHKHQRDATEQMQIFISRLLQNVVNTQPWIKSTKSHMNHHTVWHIVQDSRLGVLERRGTKVRKGLIKYNSNKNKTILDILTHIERIWSLLDAYADTASRC